MAQRPERPRSPESWDKRYTEGELPWDTGKPDVHLKDILETHGIRPTKALEIGCGTGTNSIWLAAQGFEMTGMDISEIAVARAETKAAADEVQCRFLVGDFLKDSVPGAPFRFAYDRGCLHVFEEDEERARFAGRLASLLEPDGIWHSLIGSTDGPPRDTGPPRRSAEQIARAVEPYFEILELRSTFFNPAQPIPPAAWILVAKKRTIYPD